MDAVKITQEVKEILKTYNLNPALLEEYGMKDNWQEQIPDFVIQIIVEQTMNIIRKK